ncbi:O-antigen ligase family protein [Rhizobium sp. AQ_MP]|uniref:O-antigen ligase family protein n=1 Tax=Rhizobium sp. AQ_MP TaxID=2761536 RepID=UPI0016397138|nr:O-antigen ligase family protein [Rhizobium sp. AQ_MP]MBC2775040.1 O-antigen ligase family protein [Rhizobium sp. AQ_MP]
MKTHIDRLWQTSDFLFLTGLVVALFLGSKVTPLLVVAGVLPIPFLLHALKNGHFHVSIWRLLAPFSIYFAYCLFVLFFFTGLEASDPRPVNPSLESYSVAIAMLIVGLLRSLQIRNLASQFRKLMPWLLVACFAVLSYMMFAGIRDACRVRGLAPWPFIPALLFSTLTFICLVGWEKLAERERWLRVGLLALSIVVSTTYTGSRGVAVAQVGIFGVLMLLRLIPSFRTSTPRLYHLATAAIAGTVVSVLIGLATDCGPASRFYSTIETLGRMTSQLTAADEETNSPTQVAPAPETVQVLDYSGSAVATPQQPNKPTEVTNDASIGLRLAMWETSIAAIKHSPVFGHGSLYLQKLIHATYGFEHNHNQYLSWLVTGGVLQLTLGLIFLAIPWFISKGLSTSDRILLTTGVSLFWALAMIFDSFLSLKFYTHYFCLLCGVLYSLSNSMQESAKI